MSTCRHRAPEVIEVRVVAGYDVKLDPTELTALDELRAIVAGVPTYSRRTMSGDTYWRSASKIAHEPAGSHRWVTVHRAHVCDPAPEQTSLGDPAPEQTPLGDPAPRRGGGVPLPTPGMVGR